MKVRRLEICIAIVGVLDSCYVCKKKIYNLSNMEEYRGKLTIENINTGMRCPFNKDRRGEFIDISEIREVIDEEYCEKVISNIINRRINKT